MSDITARNLSIVAEETDLIVPAAAPDRAISWAAVAAGAFVNAALTLLLMAFGAGMGFSAVSPWAGSGISGTTFHIAAGLYLVVIAMLASTIGGYVAGRLRTRWSGIHTDEVYFRDTAHGFISWACAVVFSAALLGTAGTAIISGATAGLSQSGTRDGGPAAIYVDELFRPAAGTPPTGQNVTADAAVRAEVARILVNSARSRSDVLPADRTYLSQLVAAHTGLAPADADKRVTDVLNQAKSDLDAARSAAAKLSLWLVAALLAGALSASLAATEGGMLRDRRI